MQIDVFRVPGIGPVGVDGGVAVDACCVHVDVCDGYVAGMGDEGIPELVLDPG